MKQIIPALLLCGAAIATNAQAASASCAMPTGSMPGAGSEQATASGRMNNNQTAALAAILEAA